MRSFFSLPLLAGALLAVLSAAPAAEAKSARHAVGAHDDLLVKRHLFHPQRRGLDDVPPPTQDPFYHRPHNLSHYKPGDVIRSRKIIPTMKGIANHTGDTFQILYRTTNAEGHPSSTVTTVIRPTQGGPPKMVSYHLWEDAVNRDCAPSYTILKGDASPNVMVVGADVPVWFRFLLLNGISVVVPDYEGPKSALFAGFTAGYAILDSARAVRQFLNWPSSAEVGMTGYSEGAHVTAWAANLAPSYAPDLNIVGAAHGGTPIDMETSLRHFDKSQFSGFTLGGMYGMTVAYKEFKKALQAAENAEIRADIAAVTKPGVCHSTLRGPAYAGKAYMEMINVPGNGSVYDWAPFRAVLDRETLWSNKSSAGVGYPKFPRMIYQGRNDDVISYEAVQAYVDQQCAHGANIQFNVWESNAHTAPQVVLGGDLNAMRFFLQVFQLHGHTLDPLPCGWPTPSLLNLGTSLVASVLGRGIVAGIEDIAGQIGSLRQVGFGPHIHQTNQS